MMENEKEKVTYLERRVMQLEKKLTVLAPRMKREIIWKKYVEDFLLQKFNFDLRLQVELKCLEEDGVCEVKTESHKTSSVQNQRVVNSQKTTQVRQKNIPRTFATPKQQCQSSSSTSTVRSSPHVFPSNAHGTPVGLTRPPVMSSRISDKDRNSDVSITIVNKTSMPVSEHNQQLRQNTIGGVKVLDSAGIKSVSSSMGSQFQNQPVLSTATQYHSPIVHTSVARTLEPVTSGPSYTITPKRPAIQPLFVEVRGHPTPSTASGNKKPRSVGEVGNQQVFQQVQQTSNSMPCSSVSMANPVIVSTSTLQNRNTNTPELIVLDEDDEPQTNDATASRNSSNANNASSSSITNSTQQQYQSNSRHADSGNNVVGSSRDPPFDSFLNAIMNGVEASGLSGLRTETADSSSISIDILKDFSLMEKGYAEHGYLSRRADAINGTPVLEFNVRQILHEFDTTHEDIDQITAAQNMSPSAKKNITNAISDFLMQVYGINPPRHAKESMAESLFAFFPFVSKDTWWHKPQNKNAIGSLENKINNKRRMFNEEQRRIHQLQRENNSANLSLQ